MKSVLILIALFSPISHSEPEGSACAMDSEVHGIPCVKNQAAGCGKQDTCAAVTKKIAPCQVQTIAGVECSDRMSNATCSEQFVACNIVSSCGFQVTELSGLKSYCSNSERSECADYSCGAGSVGGDMPMPSGRQPASSKSP